MDNSQLFGWYYLAVVNLLTLGLYRWDKYCNKTYQHHQTYTD